MLSFVNVIAARFKWIMTVLVLMPSLVFANDTFIFVSFSMPTESLQQWFVQSEKAHIPILVRGLKNNSLKDTIQFLQVNFDPVPTYLMIDPERFEQYEINKVPAVVIAHDNSFDVVYGDQSLKSALEKIGGNHD